MKERDYSGELHHLGDSGFHTWVPGLTEPQSHHEPPLPSCLFGSLFNGWSTFVTFWGEKIEISGSKFSIGKPGTDSLRMREAVGRRWWKEPGELWSQLESGHNLIH